MKKKEATGAVSYVMLFTMALLMVIITFYLLSVAKLMSIQHDVDDALADAVLASLVADDVYYFETYEGLGAPVIRFKNREVSCGIYRDCMEDAMTANDFMKISAMQSLFCMRWKEAGSPLQPIKIPGHAAWKKSH